jgi:hypothetical protein
MNADDKGEFVFRGVAPGSYRIFAWPDLPEGEAEQYPPFLTPFEARGEHVSVMSGVPTLVRVDVIPDGF